MSETSSVSRNASDQLTSESTTRSFSLKNFFQKIGILFKLTPNKPISEVIRKESSKRDECTDDIMISDDASDVSHITVSTQSSQSHNSTAIDVDSIYEVVTGPEFKYGGRNFTAFSSTGKKVVIKMCPVDSIEFSLLIQADQLLERRKEDSFMPKLISYLCETETNIVAMVIEWCDNGSLSRLLSYHRPLTIHDEHLARIMHGVSMALKFMHRSDIYHGSICCEHIIIDNKCFGRLTGFSRAQEIRPRGSFVKAHPKKAYRAPEGNLDDALAFPQDMFALGVVLYYCLYSRLPKRISSRRIDYEQFKTPSVLPINLKAVNTVKSLLTDTPRLRLTSADVFYTPWIHCAKNIKVQNVLFWDD